MFVDGFGNTTALSQDLENALTTSGSPTHNINFGTALDVSGTISPSVSISQALYVGAIHTTRAVSLTLNFKESASITVDNDFVVGSIPVTISASLSSSDRDVINKGGTVVRTLISTDYFNAVPNFKDSLTLNLTGGGLKYGGVLYSVFKDGTHTYYDFNDVTFDDKNKYVTVKSGAQSLNLVNGEYYAVFSGVAEGGASVKYLSIVATPEPGTATLSLIALVGLVARRRRRAA